MSAPGGEEGPRIRVVSNPRGGLSAARNRGIQAAEDSTYVLPLDDDDLIAPEYLNEAIPVLATNPAVGIVYSKARLFGTQEGPWDLPIRRPYEMLIDNAVFASSVYRRADWAAVGGYSEALQHGREDHDFNLKIASLGREIVRLDAEHFFYRQHSASMNRVLGQHRDWLIQSHSTIMRNNKGFYMEHAKQLWTEIFQMRDTINDLRHRYSWLEAQRARHPLAVRGLSVLKEKLGSLRRFHTRQH